MRRLSQQLDWVLIGSIIPIVLGGLATMTSFQSQTGTFDKQLLWVSIGAILMFSIASLDMRFLRDSRYIIMGFMVSLGLLLLVLVFGKTVKGAKSWFDFGGVFSFQPTDLVKLMVLTALSKYFWRRHIEIARLKHLFISALYVAVPVGLILLQPDFGSAMIFVFLWLGLALVAGISKKHILIVGGIGVVTFLVAWFALFAPYQKARIRTFLNPTADIRGSGYNA